MEFLVFLHRQPDALFNGTSCHPNRQFGISICPTSKRLGNPKFKPTQRKVSLLMMKRTLGISIERAARLAGWKTGNPARELIRRRGWPIDIPRVTGEVKSSAVADYTSGMMITDVSRKYKVGVSTVSRWLKDKGATRSLSESKALSASKNAFGRCEIGNKGVFQTKKGASWIPTDSNYEYARLEQLEKDPSVARIERCRFLVKYKWEGKWRSYNPDFMITYIDGSVVVEEVKPAKYVNDPKVEAKARAAITYLENIGLSYRFVTEREIGQGQIKLSSAATEAIQSPEYLAFKRERRLRQRRESQARYLAKRRAALDI